MSVDLVLKPSCFGCQSTAELYGSACKHLTLCLTCGKTMAENRVNCKDCGAPITRLIREYNVRAASSSDKNFFIGKFATGLPNFSKKKSENKWSLQKEGLQGRQITHTVPEKFKNWLLEDETGIQYNGQLEGAQSAKYYLLMMKGKEFVAIPAGSWYNFNKVAKYKQLTLDEAEEKMKNRLKTADGYERWMMKAANNGAAAFGFGEVENLDEKEVGFGSGRGGGRKRNRGEEDEEEEAARKSRLGLNDDDEEEGPRGGDCDMDGYIERGDDWEHEEVFSDDDKTTDVYGGEREDLAPEIPAPPGIKNDEDDEEEGDEEDGGLSKSGKELKKLLGRANGLNDSDENEDDDDGDDDMFPVLAPEQKEAVKEEPVENIISAKSTASVARGSPPTSNSPKGKRKDNSTEDPKATNGSPPKKVKSENEVIKAVNNGTPTKSTVAAAKVIPQLPSGSSPKSASTGTITEEEIKAVLVQTRLITTSKELVAKFKPRLQTKEDKDAFTAILKRISKIQKIGQSNIVVLKK